MDVDFNGRVAIVTGAGTGLGRSHAIALASRGAKVVVNDLGRSRSVAGRSAADEVVELIRSSGGEAVADEHSVAELDGASALVEAALSAYGRLDVLVNNAGFLRDKSFAKLDMDDFDAVVKVHLSGAAYCTRAAWPHMLRASYGRIVFTTSNAGLYGNFGQSNYAAAKAGLIGLMNVLAIEGAKKGVLVNTLAPMAGTAMTEGVMSPEVRDAFRPELASAAVLCLCSDLWNRSGEIIAAAGGYYASVRIVESAGVSFGRGQTVTPEMLMARWDEITDFSGARGFGNAGAETEYILSKLFDGR